MRAISRNWMVLALSLVLAARVAGQSAVPVVTKTLTIGCESCGGPTQFRSVWDVAISPTGEILVTDRDAPMLRRFDATGKPTWTGGMKGKGPGEFTLPIRAAITATGITVVDMTNSRVTDLSPTGAVVASTPLTRMPMAATLNNRGELLIGSDDFRGTLTVFKRDASGAIKEVRTIPGSKMNVAVAVAADGSTAIMLDTKKYEILRFDAAGSPLPSLTRDIPPARRTPEEEAEFRARVSRDQAMVAAEAKRSGGQPKKPVFRPDELSFKDHLTIDGLRFDGAGRLWVLTQRGTEKTSAFDVFSPAGALLGTVTLPQRVSGYSHGGNWMVTAGENEDGVPVVTVWVVR